MSEIVNIVAVSKVLLQGTDLSLPQLLGLSEHRLREKRPYLRKLKTGRSLNQFSGYFIRLKSGTITVFKTGKVIINGLKEWMDLVRINDQFTLYLMKNLPDGVDFEFEIPRVVNITGCRNLQREVQLEQICERDACASYEPEIFPNLQYTFSDNKKVKGIVSRRGKIIVTGVKTYIQLRFYLKKLGDRLDVLMENEFY